MATRIDLNLEQKINLIKDNENGMSFRQLKDKFHVSVGSISNILKRKNEYMDDYECNKNKKMKRKSTINITQETPSTPSEDNKILSLDLFLSNTLLYDHPDTMNSFAGTGDVQINEILLYLDFFLHIR